MLEPGIGVYNPDGGDMGIPEAGGQLQKALDTAGSLMEWLSKENGGKPTKICLSLPPGVNVFAVAGQTAFNPLKLVDDEFRPTDERVMYFTYSPEV